jgi:hypothetical protein
VRIESLCGRSPIWEPARDNKAGTETRGGSDNNHDADTHKPPHDQHRRTSEGTVCSARAETPDPPGKRRRWHVAG